MVPMPMAPYDAVNLLIVDSALSKDLVDCFRDFETGNTVLDGAVGCWGMVPPVFSAAKIEHKGLALLFVLH